MTLGRITNCQQQHAKSRSRRWKSTIIPCVRVIWKYDKSYPAVMLLSKILPIHITLGNGIIGIDGQSSVSDLNWQTIFKIQKADLANIFQLTACLANLSFFKSGITTRSPPKNCEWPCTNLALLIKVCLCLHPDEQVPTLNNSWRIFLTVFQNWSHHYEIYICTKLHNQLKLPPNYQSHDLGVTKPKWGLVTQVLVPGMAGQSYPTRVNTNYPFRVFVFNSICQIFFRRESIGDSKLGSKFRVEGLCGSVQLKSYVFLIFLIGNQEFLFIKLSPLTTMAYSWLLYASFLRTFPTIWLMIELEQLSTASYSISEKNKQLLIVENSISP